MWSSDGSRRPRRLAPRLTAALLLGLLAVVARPAAAEGRPEPPPTPATFDQYLAGYLDSLAAPLPEEIRSGIRADRLSFALLLLAVLREPAELTILVDNRTPLPATHEPDDLVDLDRHAGRLALSRPGHRLRAVMLPALFEMVDAAAREGVTLLVSSAYRSYDYQERLYGYWVRELGQAEAGRVSARPGTSEHQLGTVIDFGCICDEFAHQPAGIWLREHAHRFGFSLSYPVGAEALTGYRYEPWHYRYLGPAATALKRRFFGDIQQHLLAFLHAARQSFPRVQASHAG